MAYRFDDRGWYDGEVLEGAPRSTGEPPPITSTTTTPGEQRANWSGLAWVVVPYSAPPGPDLDALRAAHWESIKAERDRRTLHGGYRVAGKWFHSDVFSRSQQIGMVMLGASLPAGLQWKTMDGSFVPMTPTLAQQVFGAAAASDALIFGAAEAKRASLEASTTPWDYNVLAGWPPIFGE